MLYPCTTALAPNPGEFLLLYWEGLGNKGTGAWFNHKLHAPLLWAKSKQCPRGNITLQKGAWSSPSKPFALKSIKRSQWWLNFCWSALTMAPGQPLSGSLGEAQQIRGTFFDEQSPWDTGNECPREKEAASAATANTKDRVVWVLSSH